MFSQASCQRTAPGSDLRICVAMDEYRECRAFGDECGAGQGCCLLEQTQMGLCCKTGSCVSVPDPVFGKVNICKNYTTSRPNPPPMPPTGITQRPPSPGPAPPRCKFNKTPFHNPITFEVWELTTNHDATQIQAQSLNDTQKIELNVLRYSGGRMGWWMIQGIVFGNNMTGRVDGNCQWISAYPPQPLPSGQGGIHWNQGGVPPPVGVCKFQNATYHNVMSGEGVWAEVMLLNSLSDTSFTIESLNNTFKPATAHISIDAGECSLGNFTLEMADGSSQVRTFRIEMLNTVPVRCQSISLFWGGPSGHDSHDSWNLGPAPMPGPRPCATIYDAKTCAHAWKNTCSWCTSKDKAHQLCFSESNAKALPESWSCKGLMGDPAVTLL